MLFLKQKSVALNSRRLLVLSTTDINDLTRWQVKSHKVPLIPEKSKINTALPLSFQMEPKFPNHGITESWMEYPDLEGIHDSHCVQLLALLGISQQSQRLSESIDQAHPELCQPCGHDHFLEKPVQCLSTLWDKNLSQISNLSVP